MAGNVHIPRILLGHCTNCRFSTAFPIREEEAMPSAEMKLPSTRPAPVMFDRVESEDKLALALEQAHS